MITGKKVYILECHLILQVLAYLISIIFSYTIFLIIRLDASDSNITLMIFKLGSVLLIPVGIYIMLHSIKQSIVLSTDYLIIRNILLTKKTYIPLHNINRFEVKSFRVNHQWMFYLEVEYYSRKKMHAKLIFSFSEKALDELNGHFRRLTGRNVLMKFKLDPKKMKKVIIEPESNMYHMILTLLLFITITGFLILLLLQ